MKTGQNAQKATVHYTSFARPIESQGKVNSLLFIHTLIVPFTYCYVGRATMKSLSILLFCSLYLSSLTFTQAIDWQSGSGGKVVWAYGCDYLGNDLKKHSDVPEDLCGDLCVTNSDCTHFTYNRIYKVCYLKKANPLDGARSLLVTDTNYALCGSVPHRVKDWDIQSEEED